MSRLALVLFAFVAIGASPVPAQTLVRGLDLKVGGTWATVANTTNEDPSFVTSWSVLAGVHWPQLAPRVVLVTEAGYVERGFSVVYFPAPPPLLPGGPVPEPSRQDTRFRYATVSPLVEVAVLDRQHVGIHALAGPRLNILLSPRRELAGLGPAYRKFVWEASTGLGVRSRTRIPVLLEGRYNHGLSSANASEWLGESRAALRHRAFDLLVGVTL